MPRVNPLALCSTLLSLKENLSYTFSFVSALPSLSASLKNQRSEGSPTSRPPPTDRTALGSTRPSTKIVCLSYLPSELVSSKQLTRPTGSFAPTPSIVCIYPRISTTYILPLPSHVRATGSSISGSDATNSIENSSGKLISFIESKGFNGAVLGVWLTFFFILSLRTLSNPISVNILFISPAQT